MKTQTAKRERNPRDHRLQKGSLTNKETTDRQTNSSDPSSLDNVEASQPGNPEDDQKAPATPPVQTGKPNSQDWRNKLEKQKQQRREIVIVRQEQDNARSPFECRFCDWFCSTAYKTMRHERPSLYSNLCTNPFIIPTNILPSSPNVVENHLAHTPPFSHLPTVLNQPNQFHPDTEVYLLEISDEPGLKSQTNTIAPQLYVHHPPLKMDKRDRAKHETLPNTRQDHQNLIKHTHRNVWMAEKIKETKKQSETPVRPSIPKSLEFSTHSRGQVISRSPTPPVTSERSISPASSIPT
ncbi:hypothetical protein BLNAU_16118 [Blattamonas nauphoetae]|uniref:Uncharacterized protein n=1 Tax=Blattamonas nauphoetae TaxID=2049346 RepID=A0ABQ9XCD5_9EUKA|nr:hypothetical protein BLNAU_16118 [Blattamonas nauphoetae]